MHAPSPAAGHTPPRRGWSRQRRVTGSRSAALAGQRLLTESLGGTYYQLTRLADQAIPAALLAFAHAQNATQLVLGARRRGGLAALRPAATVRAQLIRRDGGIDVHVLTCTLTT